MTFVSRNSAAALGFALGLVLAAPASPAAAADWPEMLRPSFIPSFSTPTSSRWGGYYAGAHYGHTNMNADFGNSLQPIVANHLRNTALEAQFSPSTWSTLPKVSTSGKSYGGFMGYNVDWGDVVLGFEGSYTYNDLRASASDSVARTVTLSDGTVDAVTITGSSSIHLRDSVVLRGRAGYAFGQFMPYLSVGVAIGRFAYSTTATTVVVETPSGGGGPSTFTFGPTTESKDRAYMAGFAGGAGIDVLLLPNVFLRGEWEYVGYGKLHGMKTDTHTARVGLGVRF